ncbi:hypothetical protein G5I_11610 [Acromyrmex echinatior]|uniref:Uncharacterized protein n=1 Tax=Acromyrmex echinatior TaxID=103372 RepID=F4X028_ACREC|nr:hypothetical protein G5I_11610 [Acromyrmex echinatior]
MPLKRWLLLWSIGTSTRLEFPPTSRQEGRFRAPRQAELVRTGRRGISFRVLFRLKSCPPLARAEGFILSFMYESRILRDRRAKRARPWSRSHVKPLAAVYISPKRQVSCAFNTADCVVVDHPHYEGGNTWAIRHTYNGYIARSSPVSRIPSLNLNVYALRGGDAARYNAPTSDARRHSHVGIRISNRGDFASLVRNLLGPIYGDSVMNLLIRQARDILVCAYHGNLENFVRTYLSPAAVLLAEVKNVASETCVALRLPVLSVVKQSPPSPPSPLSLDGICILASIPTHKSSSDRLPQTWKTGKTEKIREIEIDLEKWTGKSQGKYKKDWHFELCSQFP